MLSRAWQLSMLFIFLLSSSVTTSPLATSGLLAAFAPFSVLLYSSQMFWLIHHHLQNILKPLTVGHCNKFYGHWKNHFIYPKDIVHIIAFPKVIGIIESCNSIVNVLTSPENIIQLLYRLSVALLALRWNNHFSSVESILVHLSILIPISWEELISVEEFLLTGKIPFWKELFFVLKERNFVDKKLVCSIPGGNSFGKKF